MMNTRASHLLIPIVAQTSLSAAHGADKSSFNLFNPVPKEQMRELATDRPDRTESPYSVDPGHFQFEVDLVNSTLDGGTTSTNFASFNAKAGLTESMDFQILFSPASTFAGAGQSKFGVGDLTLRLKKNIFGNDEGDMAFGVMPYITLPTQSESLGSSSTILGASIPFAYPLPAGFSGGLMLEPTYDLSSTGEFNDKFAFASMITFGHDIWGDVGGYIEFYNELSASPWVSTLDLGLTWGMTPDLQWDVGANIGMTDATEDLNWFAGVSFRL